MFIVCLVMILVLGYGLYSTRTSLQMRISTLEQTLEGANQQIAEFRGVSEEKAAKFASDLEVITERMGVTANDLQKARVQLAQRIKQQQEMVEQKLATELATKASSTDVDTLRQESVSRLAQVQQDANAKLGTVSGEVTVVKQDLATTRQDLSRDLLDVKNTLNDGIARNASELAQLRKKGEREYIEFDIRKNSKAPYQRIGDIQVALTKADMKRQKYSVTIQVDDSKIEKKDRTINEPVQFLVGRDQVRYELVINSVSKDQIRGYLSTPKDRILSAEGPTFRAQ
jgi:uncharacterized coiled-coil protein SlyX